MASNDLTTPVSITLLLYVVVSYALAWRFSRKIESREDYLVAGRRLPLPLASATLLATWFGAGTLLTAADEVRDVGLRAIALEPLGAALCLLIAGVWVARPLWEMKLETLGDFFRARFGRRVELWASVAMVPGYFGWIAVQLVALAEVIHLMIGIPPAWGIALVAAVGTGYTLLGGMWAVTVTDAVQLSLLAVGLVVLTFQVLAFLGDGAPIAGLSALGQQLPAEAFEPVPTKTMSQLVSWIGVLAVASLGNLPGQDLTQRIFAARSSSVARRACLLAGFGYLVLGAMPVLLGLAARILAPSGDAIVPALARATMSPVTATVFVVAITGAVLSTIDSAILAPAGVLSKNVLPRVVEVAPLTLDRLCVVGVATASLAVAYVGESAYALLEEAYGLGLMALFVPLVVGLRDESPHEVACLAAIAIGATSWAVHALLDFESFLEPIVAPLGLSLPAPLVTVAMAWLVYRAVARWRPVKKAPASDEPS